MSKIHLKSEIINDRYTEYIYDAFDIQDKATTEVDIEYHLESLNEFEWNVGVIVGSSGSGKTTILKQLGTVSSSKFDDNKSLISNFDWMEPKEVTMLFSSMGLSSVPTWLRPFRLLSNGEQYRAELAYKVAKSDDNSIILVDEYTSVVDRDVAKAMSFALQKYIRKHNKKIILASCHYDIIEWLLPDWTCSPQKGGALERGDYLRQGRPKIELQVSRVTYDTWDFFKKHHYLTQDLNKSFGLLLFQWNNRPIGIVVYKPQASGSVPNAYALSRTVVLPDYQGMGIGSRISEFVCSILLNDGKRVFTKTVNPALGEHRERSANFKPTSKHMQVRNDALSDKSTKNRLERASYCHEYIGEPMPGYEELLKPISQMKLHKTEAMLSKFFEF